MSPRCLTWLSYMGVDNFQASSSPDNMIGTRASEGMIFSASDAYKRLTPFQNQDYQKLGEILQATLQNDPGSIRPCDAQIACQMQPDTCALSSDDDTMGKFFMSTAYGLS